MVVIPVIVSDNPWLDDPFLKKLLALPTDGRAIKSSFWDSQEQACMDVHNGVRKVVDEIEKYLLKNCQKGDLVITMGAGNINEVGRKLVS